MLATALFDRPAFKRVVAHGIVLGNDGLKMSKSKGNYPNVNEVFDRDGSDAMRWFLMSSPILRGRNLIVTEEGIREGVRQAMLPMWNAYSFLALYASKPAEWSTSSSNVLDRYILAKLHDTIDEVTNALDNTDVARATDEVRWFCDALTNWYVRRSRDRFWAGDTVKPEAFNTLYTVLETLTRVTAPLLPMLSEVLWRALTGGRSVHLADWPSSDAIPSDPDLAKAMDGVRSACSAASSLRKAHHLRNRLPLLSVTVAMPHSSSLEPFADIIRDEVNVKDVILTDDVNSVGRFEAVVNARVAGPRLGKDIQKAIKAVKAGDYTVDGDVLRADGIELKPEEFTRRLVAVNPDTTAEIEGTEGLVVIDTTMTPELEVEGWAADRIRGIQEARKQAGLNVSDRIELTMYVPDDKVDMVKSQKDTIASEVLATSVEIKAASEAPSEATDLSDGCFASVAVDLRRDDSDAS